MPLARPQILSEASVGPGPLQVIYTVPAGTWTRLEHLIITGLTTADSLLTVVVQHPGSSGQTLFNSYTVPIASTVAVHLGMGLSGGDQIQATCQDGATLTLVGTEAKPVYVATATAMPKAANKNYLSILQSNSTDLRRLEVIAVRIHQEDTSAVQGLIRGYRLLRISAHSGGTPVAVEKLSELAADLGALVGALSNGQSTTTVGAPLAVQSLGEEETGGGGHYLLFHEDQAGSPIVCDLGKGVVVRQDATAGVGLVSASIYFRVREFTGQQT